MSKSMSMLLRKASSMNTARIEKQIDGKLNDQFRYFRREFMEAASAQGVTMPLELVEDKSGRFFTFVNANGPRYLLQIIHSQPEASAIMRCAISLLIVTMAILRRKLPENRPKAAGTNWMSLLSGNINSWASQILGTISDGASVSICINLLAKSKILVIRELVLSLLALLVNTSEEAVIQMVTLPNHQQITAKEMEERFKKDNPGVHPHYKLTIDDKIKFNPTSPHGTCLAVMFSIVTDNRNHYSIVSACAEVVIAMTQHKSAKIAQIIAGTSTQGPPPKERKESEHKTLLKTVLNPHSNRDVQKPATATKRAGSAEHKKRSPSRSGGDAAELGLPEEAPQEPVRLAEHATWDAMHILIQFLHRFFRYTDIAAPDQSWNSMSAGDRKRLVQAHNRIVVAVSSMINLAPDIGYYVYQMPKARNIVVTSAKFFLSSNMAAPSGLPVKERGNSVSLVSGALEVLSPDFQANYMRPSSRSTSAQGGGGGGPGTPLSRINSRMASFMEGSEDKEEGAVKVGSPSGSPGNASLNATYPADRKSNRPSVIERADSRKESMLPVVKVSQQQKDSKASSPKKKAKKKPDIPQSGTNSLVEYAHLFGEGSDWVSLDEKGGLGTAESADGPTADPELERPEAFEQRLREDYEKERRREQKRMVRERALSGRFGPEGGDSACADEDRRPMTAPTVGTTVCEFFQFMPPAPSLPRRLTALDVSGQHRPASSAPQSASRNAGSREGQPSPSVQNDSRWDMLDENIESFGDARGHIRPSTTSAGKRKKQSKTEKILEGAMMAYGKPRSQSGGGQGRRSRAGARPSTSSARLRPSSEEEFPPRPSSGVVGHRHGGREEEHGDFTLTRVDHRTGETVTLEGVTPAGHQHSEPQSGVQAKQNGERRPQTGAQLDGVGRPEALTPGPQSIRPPAVAYSGGAHTDPQASLFLSVVDGGHDGVFANREQDDDLNMDASSAEQPDQPSMWVSEVDKNSVFLQDGSQEADSHRMAPGPRGGTRKENGTDASMSRMLIADIINSFEDDV